jgi:hypothetical protein
MKNKLVALLNRILGRKQVIKIKNLEMILSSFNDTISDLRALSSSHRGYNKSDEDMIAALRHSILTRTTEASRADNVADRLKELVS